MSPTLAMILAAVMAVPANEPKKAAGEMVRQPQPLDLSGEWEGTLWDSESKDKGCWTVKLSDDWLVLERGGDTRRLLWQMTNEAGGKVKVELCGTVFVGRYRRESDRVMISLRDKKRERPIAARPGDDRGLLILHRAKPGSLRFLGTDSDIAR